MISCTTDATYTYSMGHVAPQTDGQLLFAAGREIAFLQCEVRRLEEHIQRLEKKLSKLTPPGEKE